jgi:hypothetical protein
VHYCISEFREVLATCVAQNPKVFQSIGVLDLKAWVEPYMFAAKMENITEAYYFQFRKVKGIVRMRYKIHSIDQQFFPNEQSIDDMKYRDDDMIDGYQVLNVR